MDIRICLRRLLSFNMPLLEWQMVEDGTRASSTQTWTCDRLNTAIWNRKDPVTERIYVMQSTVGNCPGKVPVSCLP